MAVLFTRRGAAAELGPSIPIGTTWLFEEDGTFAVPATGSYQVEMHGGGGGGAFCGLWGGYFPVGGGGSGELYTVELTAGAIINVTIGAGGAGTTKGSDSGQTTARGGTGGTTTFGNLSLSGGAGGYANGLNYSSGSVAGAASGSLASAGEIITSGAFTYDSATAGGQGNTGNTPQTYGDGGSATASTGGVNGQPGAVIITFLG